MQFHNAAVAGTFDRLHKGHEVLLAKAFTSAEHVSIGITSDAMAKDKQLSQVVMPYVVRLEMVKQFIADQHQLDRVSFFELHDVYGPAITDPDLDSLVVSSQTIAGGNEVNRVRAEKGMRPLAIVVCDYIESEDDSYLSSTRIRYGEINRQGHVYRQFLLEHASFTIPEALRSQLKQPLGEFFSGSEADLGEAIYKSSERYPHALFTYTVGDIVSQAFLSNNQKVDLVVFDNRTKRGLVDLGFTLRSDNNLTATNDAGSISKDAVEKIIAIQKQVIENGQRQYLQVIGEEDLLVLPLILTAPLTTVIYYGQVGQGIVGVEVTEEQKAKTEQFLRQCF